MLADRRMGFREAHDARRASAQTPAIPREDPTGAGPRTSQA